MGIEDASRIVKLRIRFRRADCEWNAPPTGRFLSRLGGHPSVGAHNPRSVVGGNLVGVIPGEIYLVTSAERRGEDIARRHQREPRHRMMSAYFLERVVSAAVAHQVPPSGLEPTGTGMPLKKWRPFREFRLHADEQ